MSHFMITHSGREHYLSGHEVRSNQIDIRDVAQSLAQINRFTGHCHRPYCVAEHSMLVADLAKRDGKSALIQYACLMHDGHESTSGDVSSPAKHAIGLGWATFEHRQADVFRRQFGLLTAFQAYRDLINHYDLVALATERRDLTSYDAKRNQPWPILDTPGKEVPPMSVVNLNNLTAVNRGWREWRDLFLAQFFSLSRQVHAAEPMALE
jgi:uncharacterized protein